MTVGDLEAEEPSKFAMLVELVRSRMLTLLAVFLGFVSVSLFAWWYFSPQIGMPRSAKLLGLAAIVTAPYWALVFLGLRSLLWNPSTVWVLDVDVTDLPGDNVGALYELAPEDFRELEVADGELDQWAPNLYAGKRLDLDASSIVGTWTGTATDRELIAHLANVRLARERLEPRARKWDELRPILPWLVRGEAADQTESAMVALEDQIMPGGAADGSAQERMDAWLDEEPATGADREQSESPIEDLREIPEDPEAALDALQEIGADTEPEVGADD